MAFYFALLNVSTKREDRNVTSSSSRQRRRRHSIASVESPILDYRLLPRPQIVRNEFYHTEPEVESRRQHDHRSGSSIRPYDESTEQKQKPKQSKQNSKEIKQRKMRKSNSTNFNSSKQSKRRTEKGLDKELWKMQLTTSTSKKDDNGTNRTPNETTEVSSTSSRGIESSVRNVPNTAYKWKSKRPIVVKRRFSPTHESSTSDSQRSSNQSCRSPPRNDSLVSSNSSSRIGETIPEDVDSTDVSSPTDTQKVLDASLSIKICDLPRSSTLKKVTFENDASQFFVNNSFLGERRVLVRRSSGSTLHQPSIIHPLSPSSIPIALLPFAEKTASLAGLTYGADLWVPFSNGTNETPKKQNAANKAIEEIIRRKGKRSLIRRHSTSDCHVFYGFQNEGFRMANDETPKAKSHLTTSSCAVLPFTG